MGIVGKVVHSIGQNVRTDAKRLLVPVLLALAGGLAGAAGVAFLTASAYLRLSLLVGHATASLLVGLGLTVLAALFVVLARSLLYSKKTLTDPQVSPTAARKAGEPDFASQIAFTAAFVLARYLGEGRRD